MSDARDLPDSTEMLIGCYTDDEGTDGVLVAHATQAGAELGAGRVRLHNPSWLVAFDEYVLAACELPHSALAVLRRTGDGWEVASQAPTGGTDACHLAVSPDDAWVAVANYTSGQVSLFAAPQDGVLRERTALYTFTGSGPVAGRQDAPHAHQVTWLDERHFLVSDLGCDRLRVMRVDDGALVELEPVVLPAGMGPRHAVLRRAVQAGQPRPEEAGELYLAIGGELSGEVVSLRHEGTEWDQGWWVVSTVMGTFQPGASQPSGLRLFGDDLVLANRRVDTVALLRWNEEGILHLVAEHPCGGDQPRDLAVHDGRVWVANQLGNNVTVLTVGADEFQTAGSATVQQPASLLFLG